jgi:hypothetical protein
MARRRQIGREAAGSIQEGCGVSKITSRLRAAIGALGILACASPVAAQTHLNRGHMRVAAQWVDRNQSVRQPLRWRRAAEWRRGGMGWRRGYAVGYGWRGPAFRRPLMRREMMFRHVRPRVMLQRRLRHRPRAGGRYGIG